MGDAERGAPYGEVARQSHVRGVRYRLGPRESLPRCWIGGGRMHLVDEINVYQMNGGSDLVSDHFVGMRPSKVTAKALRAGFHLVAHPALPLPVGSRDRVTRYRHSIAACSLGKWPRTRTARR